MQKIVYYVLCTIKSFWDIKAGLFVIENDDVTTSACTTIVNPVDLI